VVNQVRILGLHRVTADEPVHLIEIQVTGDVEAFNFDKVTQELANEPQSNWQVPYDERLLAKDHSSARFAFFFHYLQADRPLLTPFGPAVVPTETTRPEHLRGVEYEQPR